MTNPTIELWTPGPWSVLPVRDMETRGDTIPVATTDRYPTAFVPAWTKTGTTAAEAAANARLIATAPKLYRQLEIFVSTIVNDDLLALDHELAAEVEATRALLAEARGEQQ